MKTLKLTCFLLLLSLAGIAQTRIFHACSGLKDIVTKYTVTIKKDRTGSYKLYSVPFKQTEFEKVLYFFKKID